MFSLAYIRRGNTNDHAVFDDRLAACYATASDLVSKRDATCNGLPILCLRGIDLEVEQGGDVVVWVNSQSDAFHVGGSDGRVLGVALQGFQVWVKADAGR